MDIRLRRRLRRGIAISIASAALVAGGISGAAPAQAAGSYKVDFKYQIIDGYKKSSILRGSGSSGDTIKTGIQWYGPSKAPKPKVTVQRKVDGGKWKTIKAIKAKRTSKFYFSAKLPAYTVPAGVASQKVYYRFKSTKSGSRGVRNTDYSKKYTVTYDNQAMYTGFAATMYSYMQPYCSTVAVRLDPAIAASGHAGEYHWSRGITIDPGIEAAFASRPNPAAYAQGVALHECAHFKQFQNFGASATGWNKQEKAAAAIFIADINPGDPDPEMQYPYVDSPIVPLEHGADCASHSVLPTGYLGYGGYCNPGELAAGNRLLTQGTKY